MSQPLNIAERMKLAMGRQVGVAIQFIDRGASLEKVDAITQLSRITTCEACPRFQSTTRQCLECGCPMDYKTTLATDPVKALSGDNDTTITCPLNRWT